MYCTICFKDIIHCTCPDIEERLKKAGECAAVRPAIEQNLRARIEHKLAEDKWNGKLKP